MKSRIYHDFIMGNSTIDSCSVNPGLGLNYVALSKSPVLDVCNEAHYYSS
jgi:hypothetical protein